MRLLELAILRRLGLRRVGAAVPRRPGMPAGLQELRRLVALRVLYRREVEAARDAQRWAVPHAHLGRRWPVQPTFAARRQFGAWYGLIPLMRRQDPEKFVSFLRMTPVHFDKLLAEVEPVIRPRRNLATAISAGQRLAITLRFLASGDHMMSLSYLFLVAPPSISTIIRRTCRALWETLQSLPVISEENWKEVAADFQERWDYPNCFGAADGKHFQIQNFPEGGVDWFNCKGTFSMVLLALVDAKLKFRAVDVGGMGSRSDGGLFRRSNFVRRINAGTFHLPPPQPLPGSNTPIPYVMVADEAFGLSPNVMTPFPGRFLPDEQNIYNYRHSRARRTSENAFGLMTAWFRLFRGPFVAGKRTAKAVIEAGVALHNWLLQTEEEDNPERRRYLPRGFADVVGEDGEVVEGEWRYGAAVAPPGELLFQLGPNPTPANIRLAGEAVREEFVDCFLGPARVEWQWQHLRFLH